MTHIRATHSTTLKTLVSLPLIIPVIWCIIAFQNIHLSVKCQGQCFRNVTILEWYNYMKDFTGASFCNIQNSVEYIIFNPVIYILSTRCQSRRVIYPFSSQFCVHSWRWEYWCHDAVEWNNPLLALETKRPLLVYWDRHSFKVFCE